MSDYKDGSKNNPVPCFDYSECFDCARERDRPVWCFVKEANKLFKAFPSGRGEYA